MLSNSVYSLQFANRAFRCLFHIFHFPIQNSKSLLEDSGEAVMIRSPLGANFNAGMGKPSIWAVAVLKMVIVRTATKKARVMGVDFRPKLYLYWSIQVLQFKDIN